eukprot:Skav236038  [mRNA]  locus=scaffold1509:137009:142218:+ [translate_table: standard]
MRTSSHGEELGLSKASAEDPNEERKLVEAAAAQAADAAVAMAPEDQVLSKQVLWQKAFITEMAKQKSTMLETEALDALVLWSVRWSHHICLPWMDQPLKRAELDYQAAEVITTLPGERVLVLCTIHYVANWSSPDLFLMILSTLNKFEAQQDRGLQSVRALGPSQPRTMLMATVDEPPPGPHLYRARAALTTGEECQTQYRKADTPSHTFGILDDYVSWT